MPRGAGKRTWIKLYPVDCLDGSIRYQLGPDERGVWYDLLNFSAICATPGSISDKDARPFPHSFIANRLNIPLELLESTLAKCTDEGRITENGHGIHITNWTSYQSEYERQKPYRQKEDKVTPNVTEGYSQSYSKKGQVEVEEKVEIKREERREEGDVQPPPPSSSSDSSDKIINFYERNIGLVTPMLRDEIEEAIAKYPPAWIEDAMAEAVRANVKNWRYTMGILKSWKKEGRMHG